LQVTLTANNEQEQSERHGGHKVPSRVPLLPHLERQHAYVETMSRYQPTYGAKLSPLAWRFQLMVDTLEWLKRWINAKEDFCIELEDCIKKVLESDRVPLLVKQFGHITKCWCFPEVRTLEEVLANVKDVSRESINDAMKNWMSTWFELRKEGIEPSETLTNLRNNQEELVRSMNTCTEVKKWLGAFQIVFELKEGDMKTMVLDMMLQKYKGMDMSTYTKQIHGCTCGNWHRYFICIHAMAFNIIKKALPWPDEWNPKQYKGTSQTFHVTSLVGGKQQVGKSKSKSRKVRDALKRGDPILLCFDCCKRRREKVERRLKKRKLQEAGCSYRSPAKKKRNVNGEGALECDNDRNVDATPKTPDVEHGSKRRKTKEAKGKCTDEEREDGDDTDENEGESQEEEVEEEHNVNNETAVAYDQGTVGRVPSDANDESEYTGLCEECNENTVSVRRDLMGKCDGNSHTLSRSAYNVGLRRLLRSGSFHSSSIENQEPGTRNQEPRTPKQTNKTKQDQTCNKRKGDERSAEASVGDVRGLL